MAKKKGKKEATAQLESAVNTYSRPSKLRITDLRVARVAAPFAASSPRKSTPWIFPSGATW